MDAMTAAADVRAVALCVAARSDTGNDARAVFVQCQANIRVP